LKIDLLIPFLGGFQKDAMKQATQFLLLAAVLGLFNHVSQGNARAQERSGFRIVL